MFRYPVDFFFFLRTSEMSFQIDRKINFIRWVSQWKKKESQVDFLGKGSKAHVGLERSRPEGRRQGKKYARQRAVQRWKQLKNIYRKEGSNK